MTSQRRAFSDEHGYGGDAAASGVPLLALRSNLGACIDAPSAGEWRSYGGDLGAKPLRRARPDHNRDNSTGLKSPGVSSGCVRPRPEINFEERRSWSAAC